MKYFTREEIDNLHHLQRANLINSVTGYKPANLIGTISDSGTTNLAVFSSVIHLGANPPLIGFIMRPTMNVPRQTFQNIKENGFYTINHIHQSFIEKAHFTSAKFDKNVSEFEQCKLTEEYYQDFSAPFVKESEIKIGLKLVEEIPINLNNTILVIGEIVHLILPEHSVFENGSVDLNSVADVCISGLDTYHEVTKIATFPYARTGNLPEFR